MPNSKHRKKQLIANRKQLDKARKKIQKSADILPESTEDEFNSKKENRPPSPEIRQQCNKEVDTSLDNDIEGEDVSEEILNEDAGTWFGGLYGWCHSGIAQSVEAAKDMVFPSRCLKRQLDDAQLKLRKMEEELEQIKEETKRKKLEGATGSNISLSPTPVSVTAPPPPPPPPAPPPPPPPPPPIVPPPKRVMLTRSKTTKLAKIGKELPPISLDDIKRVKLKTAGERRCPKRLDRKSGCGDGGFVISLADLKSVNLRKANSSSSSRRKSFHCSKDFSSYQSPPKFCQWKDLLKKVSPPRSPGGTIIKDQNSMGDFGEGPTPMLTRALKRKFQAACPVSPIGSFSPSPMTSPAEGVPSSPSSSFTTPPPPPPISMPLKTNNLIINVSPRLRLTRKY